MTRSDFDIILYGGPGAGKGTQADILVEKLDAALLEMGEQLRRFVQGESEEARQAKAIVARGELVPPAITKNIVADFLAEVPRDKRIIFDGYPRSVEQAKDLEKLLAEHGRDAAMIYIKLPESAAVERLTKRAQVEHRADDLNIETIKNRIAVFNNEAKDLLAYYDQQNQLFVVNGDQNVEQVAGDIGKVIHDA